MANDLNSIDYGFRPTGPGAGFMQGQEQAYIQAARARAEEAAQQEAERKAKHDEASRQYTEALAANARDSIAQRMQASKDAAVYKTEQANQLRDVNARPLMQATVDMAGTPNQGMDMGRLAQAARMYSQLESQMPEAVRKVMSTPRTYKDPQTGQTFQSNFDPEAMAALTGAAQKDKNTANLEKQSMVGQQNQELEALRQQGRMELQKMRGAAQQAVAAAKAKGNTKIEGLIVEAYNQAQQYAESPQHDPQQLKYLQDKLNSVIQIAVASKPATTTNTITDDGIQPAPNRAQPAPIAVPTPNKTVDFNSMK